MVMVGTKRTESALVEMLFSWCCLWFFPMTSPAVQELVRKVTTAEQIATMRYRMKAFMLLLIIFIVFKCSLFECFLNVYKMLF